MAWGDTSGQRGAAQKWTSENVPNYSGTAYGMNQGSSFYDPDMFNRTPEMGWSNMAGSEPYATPSQGYDRAGSATGIRRGPSYHDRLTGKFNAVGPGAGRGIATLQDEDEGMGMVGHAKQALSGSKWPSFMMADSIVKNQKQHRDLDKYFQSTYGDDWRKAKNASFWQGQGFGSASKNQDMSLLSPQGRQAHGYFTRAGITDNDLDAFMNPKSKWFGNEAYLKSAAGAEGAEAFKQGMSFLKNAADTSNLHRSVFGQRDMRDYEEGEHWDIAPDREDITSDLGGDDYYEQGEHWDIAPKADEIFGTEDITSDLGGDDYYEQGEHWDIAPDGLQPHPNPAIRFGNLGTNDPANEGFIPDITEQGYTGPSTLIPTHRRKKIGDYTDPDEYLGGMYLDENEEDIIPNIADLRYFNQFQ